MAAKKIFFVFVLSRLTSLVSTDKIQKKCSFRTRLVGLISTKTKEYFVGRHLCIRSMFTHFTFPLIFQDGLLHSKFIFLLHSLLFPLLMSRLINVFYANLFYFEVKLLIVEHWAYC